MSFLRYFKVAFRNRWNLLWFLGGTVFALISGRADMLLPLVVAAELTYLGLLGTHPKFQKYVDAQAAASLRTAVVQGTEQTLEKILHSLPPKMLDRFKTLRSRCLELRQIASELKPAAGPQVGRPLEDSQTAGLDRLLWIFLRLLYTHFALSRFLQKTSSEEIERDLDRTQQRLAALPAGTEDAQTQRMRKTLEDNLATLQQRLANLKKAADNQQLVELQIDQLENRIRSLSEMTVNRQEPEFISNQVEQVTSSMVQTEQTLNELRFATGLEMLGDEPPPLLRPVEAQVVG